MDCSATTATPQPTVIGLVSQHVHMQDTELTQRDKNTATPFLEDSRLPRQVLLALSDA